MYGPVEFRSPWRLSRWRVVVWPLLAGIGATPASIANAASERIRPGWDHAHNTTAATIGPTPSWSSRSGRQRFTMVRIAFSYSTASVCKLWQRRASWRSTRAVVLVSRSQPGWMRSLAPMRTCSLLAGRQQAGQAGSMAAGALDRPRPQRAVLIHEVDQGLVALRRGRDRQVHQRCPVWASITAAVWVSTPMT